MTEPAQAISRSRHSGESPLRNDPHAVLEVILDRGDRLTEPQEKLRCFRDMCGRPEAKGDDIAVFLLEEVQRLRHGLHTAQETHARLEELIEKLTTPPLHPALFLGWVDVEERQTALVGHGNTRSAVQIGDGVDVDDLSVGDVVLLSNGGSTLLSKSALPILRGGETAFFDRATPDGRVVLKWRDEEIIASCGGRLQASPPRRGDAILWDRNAWLALEVVDRPAAEHLFVVETPPESFADIGGLDEIIAELKYIFLLSLRHREAAQRYGVRRCGAVITDPQIAANALIVESEHPQAGRMRQARPAARFDGTPAELRSPAPLLGEHTDAVLTELGVSPEQLATLRAAGTVA